MCIQRTADYGASSGLKYVVKIKLLNGSMHTHGTKDRGDGEELIYAKFGFDGQPTAALPSIPLVCNMGNSLLIKR